MRLHVEPWHSARRVRKVGQLRPCRAQCHEGSRPRQMLATAIEDLCVISATYCSCHDLRESRPEQRAHDSHDCTLRRLETCRLNFGDLDARILGARPCSMCPSVIAS